MQTPGLLVFGAGVSKDVVQRTVGYAKAAEARGFHSCLVTEAASDALSLTQHVASATSRIQVGTAIFNIYLHPPLLAALQALTTQGDNLSVSISCRLNSHISTRKGGNPP
jgi:alkanesulfonate monooxygenase SsuD/methylene tetrahydromethanopterin reductase-like flavin-dependent oxidoreductase (luciferase family)